MEENIYADDVFSGSFRKPAQHPTSVKIGQQEDLGLELFKLKLDISNIKKEIELLGITILKLQEQIEYLNKDEL